MSPQTFITAFCSVLTRLSAPPQAFLATARALEMVGVSAYAGGSSLISNKSILIAAAQILPYVAFGRA